MAGRRSVQAVDFATEFIFGDAQPSEVQAIVRSSLGKIREGVAEEIQKTSKGSIRRVTKLTTRLKRLQELNPNTPLEKLVPIAAGQIIS